MKKEEGKHCATCVIVRTIQQQKRRLCTCSDHVLTSSPQGKTFSIWKLNDLHNLEVFVSLLLFNDVHKELWKTEAGTVIGILNPNPMKQRDGYDGVSWRLKRFYAFSLLDCQPGLWWRSLACFQQSKNIMFSLLFTSTHKKTGFSLFLCSCLRSVQTPQEVGGCRLAVPFVMSQREDLIN